MDELNNSFLSEENASTREDSQQNIKKYDDSFHISDYIDNNGILIKKKSFNYKDFKDCFKGGSKDYESENEKEFENMYNIVDPDKTQGKISSYNNENKNSFLGKKHKIFNIEKQKKPIYRYDYYIKAFKANFLEYLVNLSNKLFEKCEFDKNIKKFNMTNNEKYQGNAKEQDNKIFVKLKFKEVLIDYYENRKKGISGQQENQKTLNEIYKIKEFPYNEPQRKLKKILEMDIKACLSLYYESDYFQEFKNRRIIKFYDSHFCKERNRNFSLLEKDGFINLVKEPSYKRKKFVSIRVKGHK